MPLFSISNDEMTAVSQTNFQTEKALQTLIEQNLGPIFNFRFIATEFPTGAKHSGRIDTLALSEDGNPVIIEYKKVESSDLITQSLFYLSWIHDHRGDFAIAVQKALGANVNVDWSDVRVICIAPNYRRYDLHAVQVLGANFELWTYRRFSNDTLFLEQVQQGPESTNDNLETSSSKNPIMVAAGKKAAMTRAAGIYTFEQHINGKPPAMHDLAFAVNDFITGLDSQIDVVPKKFYIGYRTSQNFVCMEVHHKKITLFLKLDPKKVKGPKGLTRDVSSIGHFGTGDLELTLQTLADFEVAKPLIERAYQNIGG